MHGYSIRQDLDTLDLPNISAGSHPEYGVLETTSVR